MKGPGRPTLYRRDTARRILSAIESTGSIRKACKDPTLPDQTTVNAWAREHEGFSLAIARAREGAAHTQAGLALHEAEALATDAASGEVPRARVRAVQHLGGLRQWLAERWNRSAYGANPTVALQVNAGDGSSLTFASVLQSGGATSPPTPQCTLENALEAGSSPPAMGSGREESPPLALDAGSEKLPQESPPSAPDEVSGDPAESGSQDDADAKGEE